MNTTQQRMTAVFNEWARRYAANPDEFSAILDADGKPVEDYGQCCALYFEKIADEMDVKGLLPIPGDVPTPCPSPLETAKFYAVQAVLNHSDDFELVGVFTKDKDALQFGDDLEKSGRCVGVAMPQHLEMNVILDILVRDRLRELAEPIMALAAR